MRFITKLKSKTKKHLNTLTLTLGLVKKAIIFTYRANPRTTVLMFAFIGIFSTFGIIGNYLNSKLLDALIGVIDQSQALSVFVTMLLIYITFQFISSMESSITAFLDQYNYLKVQRHVEMTLLNKLSKLDFYYFEDPKHLDLINNVRDNLFRVNNFIDIVLWYFRYLIILILALTVLLRFSVLITVIVIIFSLPRLISRLVFGKRNFGLWEENSETRRDYYESKHYLESEHSAPEIRLYNLVNFFRNRVDKIFTGFINKQINLEKKRFRAGLLIDFVSVIGYSISIYILAKSAISGDISIGLFTFYLATINQFTGTLDRVISYSASLFESSLFINNFFKLLDLQPVITDGSKEIKVSTKPPLIEFKNVNFKYPNSDVYVFKNFNLKIQPGEKIAIVGENGAGKTTLIKILKRFYDVNDGEILINGTNIKDISKKSWYKNLSVLDQEFNRYHLDAKTNIGLGDISKLHNLNLIKNASKAVGADSFIKEYEHKYNQILSKRYPKGIDPSTGQWQKIALARAIMKDAPIVVLDEPTSAIDPKAEAEIFEMLLDFAKNKTVLIISHRFSTVRNADRIIVFAKGKIIEEGSHQDLIAKNGVYKEAFNLQKRGYSD